MWLYMRLLKKMYLYKNHDVIKSNYEVKCNWNIIILLYKEELI